MTNVNKIAASHAFAIRRWRDRGRRGRRPRMPEELAGEAVRLVGRLAGRANWRGYGWIDDAQADAIWRIVAYSHGYDQSRGAWSSWALRVAWTSFLKRCNLERRHDQIKVDLQRETPAERDEAAREYAAGLMRRWRLSG